MQVHPFFFGDPSCVRWDVHIFPHFIKIQAFSAYSFQHWIKWQCRTQRTEHSFGCFNILFLASFSSLSTEFLSPNLVVMTKKFPGYDRAFSSLSPSLPLSNSCNNCQVFLLNVVGASICVVSVILSEWLLFLTDTKSCTQDFYVLYSVLLYTTDFVIWY